MKKQKQEHEFEVKEFVVLDGKPYTSTIGVQRINNIGRELCLSVNCDQIPDAKVEFKKLTETERDRYNRQNKSNAVAGFKILVAGEMAYTWLVMPDGYVKGVNVYAELLNYSGMLKQAEDKSRFFINSLQRMGHLYKENLRMYQHFFGEPTEEHKKWLLDNTIPFEHEVNVAKEVAKLKGDESDAKK